jgi:limonene-1,2-epoxide hydrolase
LDLLLKSDIKSGKEIKIKIKISVLAYYGSRVFQEVEASRILDSRRMNVEVCQPYAVAASTHQEVILVLIYVRG